MVQVLGITPRDAKDTFVDMAYSMIEAGKIKKTKNYRGPGGTGGAAGESAGGPAAASGSN